MRKLFKKDCFHCCKGEREYSKRDDDSQRILGDCGVEKFLYSCGTSFLKRQVYTRDKRRETQMSVND